MRYLTYRAEVVYNGDWLGPTTWPLITEDSFSCHT